MSINSTSRTAGPYTGTGLVTTYPFAFKVFQESDLLVVMTDTSGVQTTLALSTDYTVALNVDQDASPGGVVTLVAVLASGYQLTLTSNISMTQPATLPNNGGFFPKVIENALDRLTILFQQLGLVGGVQALRVPEIGGIPILPSKALRANRVQGYDANGDPLLLVGVDASSAAALQLDLADSSLTPKGDALVAVKRTLTGAQARTLHDINEKDLVDVWTFIPTAVDPSTTDCSTYIQAGLNALSGTGKYLHGQNITTKVSARISVPTKTGLISDGSWKIVADGVGFTNVNPDVYETSTSTVLQLTGQTTTPFTPNEDQRVIGLKIEGSFAEGRSCNAIAARNCKNVRIESNEIYSFKHTKAIIIASLTGESRVWGNHIHDCSSNTVFAAFPTFADRGYVNITGIDIDDDAVNGVTSDAALVAFNRIYNLHHGATAIATYGDQSDGIYQNKGTGLRLLYNRIEDVNEGLDLLGYEGEIAGNYVADCDNFGIKLIHGAKRNRVHHNTVVRSGIAGIWVGANVVVANGDTEWNQITDNVIRDIDPTNTLGASTTACIKVESTGGGVYGRNNTFARNYCDPGTYGQYVIVNNSSNDTGNVFDKNEIKAAGTLGNYLVLAANNFDIIPRLRTRAQVTRSAAQAIATGAAAKVTFNSAIVDALSEFDITTNNRWVCKNPGWYFVDFQVAMALCKGLYVHIYKNGSAVASVPGVDSATDVVQAGFNRFLVYMSVADYLEGWVQHASGANRNVIAGVANTAFTVTPAP